LSGGVTAQKSKRTHVKDYLSLSDEVHFLTIFVDTDYDTWDDDELEYYYEQLLTSQNWLIDESYYHEVSLQFNNDHFIFDNQKVIDLPSVRRSGYGVGGLWRKVVEGLGYEDTDDFLSANSFDFETEKLKVLLFVKEEDRSHARNYWSVNNIDFAVVYCRSSIGTMTSHYTISHEILHLFGAWDLYLGESQTLETAKKAKEMYPNSIMINTWTNQENLVIDELTAWRIGWKDYDEEYRFFDPQINRALRTEEKRKSRLKSYKINLGKKG